MKSMKSVYLFLLCLLAWSFAKAQEGVNFREISFEEALQQAKAENKLVFMDCYTSWCGPCKTMTKEVFPQKEAGDFFNPRFVCVKYDMEKGEGKELAKKLEVHAYPTFFILRPDGSIQHRLTGGCALPEFIERVKLGLDSSTSLATLNEEYAGGKMDKPKLLTYWQVLNEADEMEKAGKIYQELLGQLSNQEKVQKEYWPLYEDESCRIGSPLFSFLLEHQSELEENVGHEKINRYIYWAYDEAIDAHVRGYGQEDVPPLAELKKQVASLHVDGKEKLTGSIALAEKVAAKDIEKLTAFIVKQAKHLTSAELVSYAHTYFWAKTVTVKPKDASALNKKMAAAVMQHLEAHRDSLSANELSDYITTMAIYIEDDIDQKTYDRLLAISEPVLAQLPDSDGKKQLEYYLQGIRKKMK